MSWVLMVMSLPITALVLILVSQSVIMCQISHAVDAYLMEYVNSSKVRKEQDEERKK